MNLYRRALLPPVFTVVALAAISCSPTQAQSSLSSSAADTSTVSSATVPSPTDSEKPSSPPATISVTTSESSSEALVSDQFRDADGYAYGIELDASSIDVDVDIAGAKPGKANLNITITTPARVTNMTPQRKAKAPDVGYFPVWSSDSDFCKLAGSDSSVDDAFYGNTSVDGAFCRISNAGIISTDQLGELGVDESIERTGKIRNGIPITVEEADVDKVVASIEAPYAYLIGRGHNGQEDPRTYDCGMFDASLNSYYLSASSAEITGCTRFPG